MTKTRAPSKKTAAHHPVTITRQPVTHCQECQEPVTYAPEPGAAAQALTEHYQRRHPAGAGG